MRINWYAIAFILVVLIVAVSAWPDARAVLWKTHLANTNSTGGYGQAKVLFSDVTVAAQVPQSAALQEQGLAGVTGLQANHGMLWLYDQSGEYTFWMKGMLIPLDFIWINKNQVVDLTTNVPPPATGAATASLPIYQPKTPADAVLEVSAGFAAAHHVAIGDPVEVDRIP